MSRHSCTTKMIKEHVTTSSGQYHLRMAGFKFKFIMYVCMYICMYVRMYVCMHVGSFVVCTYVCMHACEQSLYVRMFGCINLECSLFVFILNLFKHFIIDI